MRRSPLLILAFLGACVPDYTDKVEGDLDEDGGSGGDDGGDDPGDDGGDDGGDVPVDEDGDGFTDDEDCDDSDPEINPDAEEQEGDGADNDCDGFEDELEVCGGTWADIQGAVDAAPNRGVVQVCPGTYVEFLDVSGKDVTIASTDGADDTIVVAPEPGRSVLLVTSSGDATIIGLTLTGGAAENGGGAACVGADLALVDSVVTGNAASGDGGGVYGADCDIDLQGGAITTNAAGRYGGGLMLGGSRGDVEGASIAANTAYEGGGAFLWEGRVDLTGNAIEDNIATVDNENDWDAGGGGGGLWSNTRGAVDGNTIARNHSGYNGGGAYFYRVTADLTGNTVADNTCGEDGAGVYFSVSGGTISGNTISGNAAADDGGGLRMFFGGAVITDNTFVGNTANDDGGGAKVSHAEHVFERNVFTGNQAGDAGGGLELDNDSSHVTDGTFEDNVARRGAGIHNWRTETEFTIENSTFTGNVASDCGGGISFDNSPHEITLQRLIFEGNEAVDGAAICADLVYRDPEDVGGQENFYQDTILDIANIIAAGNTASDEGGAIYVKAGVVDIRHLTADGNSGRGAVAVKGSPVTLASSIVSDHDGVALFVTDHEESGAGSLAVSYTSLWDVSSHADGMADPVGSGGNIAGDPDYTGAWALGSGSDCVDAGDPSGGRDGDGSRADMGAYGGPSAW